MDMHEEPEQPTPLTMYVDALADACRQFSSVELCLVWRQSFAMSRRARSTEDKLRLIRLRDAFLDEFQRRDPAALEAWLSSSVPPDMAPIAFFGDKLPDPSW